jgi:hypothetical protein
MGGIVDHLDSKNLVPFKRRRNGYHLPALKKEEEAQVIDEVDPELRPEEQGYVRHYLNYADVMLKNSDAEEEQPAAPEQASEEPAAANDEKASLGNQQASLNHQGASLPESNVTKMAARDDQDFNAA